MNDVLLAELALAPAIPLAAAMLLAALALWPGRRLG
jgi:hypothetical protein